MIYADLKLRAAVLAAQEGWDKTNPQPDWGKLINRALAQFSWEAEYQTGNVTLQTVAAQAEYPLPAPDWKRVTDVVYATNTALLLTDEPTVRRLNPAWLATPATIPVYYWLSTPNTLRLHPIPNTSGINVVVRGNRADTPLVADTDAPHCPETFCEGIALLAAWIHAKQYVENADAGKLKAYYDESMKYADDCRLYLAEQTAPTFQRYVKRRAPQRILLF